MASPPLEIQRNYEACRAIFESTLGMFAQATHERGEIKEIRPAYQFLARLGALTYFHGRAIHQLSSDAQLFLPMSVLVRALIEAWVWAAWLMEPDDEDEQMRRALGFEESGVEQAIDKLEYDAKELEQDVSANSAVLDRRLAEVTERISKHGVRKLPKVKKAMKRLGHPERYGFYRWDSDAVHASPIGLGALAQQTEGPTLIGVGGDEQSRTAKLVAAWDAMTDTFHLALTASGVDDRTWIAQVARWREELHEHFRAINALVDRSEQGAAIGGPRG